MRWVYFIRFGGEGCYCLGDVGCQARVMVEIVGMGDVPLVEVKILVLSGLMKQPRDRPRSLNCWQRKSRSSSGTTVEISSMKPSKFVIPPLPSSWVIPLARRSAAR